MKKMMLCLLAMSLLCGCQKTVTDTPEPDTNNVVENENQENQIKLADKYLEAFKEIVENPEAELSTELIANKLVEKNLVEASLVADMVEEGPLSGFTADVTGFSSAYRVGPMISTIPFVAYVFETENAESLINLLNENHDLRWNICTEAEDYAVTSVDNYVFVIMCSDSQG